MKNNSTKSIIDYEKLNYIKNYDTKKHYLPLIPSIDNIKYYINKKFYFDLSI